MPARNDACCAPVPHETTANSCSSALTNSCSHVSPIWQGHSMCGYKHLRGQMGSERPLAVVRCALGSTTVAREKSMQNSCSAHFHAKLVLDTRFMQNSCSAHFHAKRMLGTLHWHAIVYYQAQRTASIAGHCVARMHLRVVSTAPSAGQAPCAIRRSSNQRSYSRGP